MILPKQEIAKCIESNTNFQLGQTRIGLSGGLTFANLAIAQVSEVTLIKIASTGEP